MRQSLAAICTPTLVIVGQYDWVCPPASSRALAAGIAGAKLAEIAGAGHFPFSEEPPAFQRAVRDFLRQPGEVPHARISHRVPRAY
ncbi:MAG TPA: alpha/beta fold hydrolase [Trebonia sp.]